MFAEKLKYGTQYSAIEHAEQDSYNYLRLAKKKQELVVSARKKATSFQEFLPQLKGLKHVFLIVNDEQVLSKNIEGNEKDSLSVARTAFPNITLSDFYFQVYTTAYNSFISIARKEYVAEIIKSYENAGISVIDFSLGNLAIQNLTGVLSQSEIFSSNAQLFFKSNELQEIKKLQVQTNKYVINAITITSDEVLLLGGIVGYYTNTASSSIRNNLQQVYKQKRFFDLGLKFSLGFLLTILFINFLLFSTYRNEISNLSFSLQLSETYKNQLNSLQSNRDKKRELVKSISSNATSNLSEYIDEIAISAPSTTLLVGFNYQPIKSSIKRDKQIVFDKNSIIIKGTSKKNSSFSDWIAALQKKDWIEKATIIHYGNGKKKTSDASFKFLIKTKDNE
jgi:hypothetical protein